MVLDGTYRGGRAGFQRLDQCRHTAHHGSDAGTRSDARTGVELSDGLRETTNALGAVIAGAAAALIGAPNALLLGCVLCSLTIIAVCWAIPQLWAYRSE